MFRALNRIESNKGARTAGADGMTVQALRAHLVNNWLQIKRSVLDGTYQPQPVRQVEIPKPGGGTRLLGIPSALDRLLQQAILQVLTPVFDPNFSDHSYGFRPGKQAHSAVRQARAYIVQGYAYVVDVGLENFFNRVNHDKLMARVARRVKDRGILGLIRKFLKSGIMQNGVKVASDEGTPQGGPLSPLLSNVLLDDLDKELERRGHRFCRYADDANIYVQTRRAGERVMKSLRRFLEGTLSLKVNEAKSAVDRPWNRKFLGFTVLFNRKGKPIIVAPKSRDRLKAKIREMTRSRHTQVPLADRIQRLNRYLRGWIGYYALAETPNVFRKLDSWIRHRLRACLWRQWKKPKTKRRNLEKLGIMPHQAVFASRIRKEAWRASFSPPVHFALTDEFWRRQKLGSLETWSVKIRDGWRTAGCDIARPVV